MDRKIEDLKIAIVCQAPAAILITDDPVNNIAMLLPDPGRALWGKPALLRPLGIGVYSVVPQEEQPVAMVMRTPGGKLL